MEEVIYYKCEYCHREYWSEEDAELCEARHTRAEKIDRIQHNIYYMKEQFCKAHRKEFNTNKCDLCELFLVCSGSPNGK